MWVNDVTGLLSAVELTETVDAIADWQLPSGMIPWFPGGHADPWNHTEAAMALLIGGRRDLAERAFDWLVARQRADGAWHRYELAERVEEDKLDANVCAYPAVGVWYHWACHGDRGFVETLWPTIERAIDFVLGLQTRRGEVLWARHADGTPWPYALLTGSSSISLSLRCALALARILGRERPDWELAAARLVHTIRAHVAGHAPDAFAPKNRWAMDWYYPVLVGALAPAEREGRMASGAARFVLDDRGVRCVSDQPWVTAAETCECALAYLRTGDRERAEALFASTRALREDTTGHYHTGLVFPRRATFPDGERSTYTAAAVILCADALVGASPASRLWTDDDAMPAVFDLDDEQAAG
ncbi:MAG: prenyltransferase [Acidimicrobiia bacterium]|nr:prenyltransferase [Acidimicrobiia bacterium]